MADRLWSPKSEFPTVAPSPETTETLTEMVYGIDATAAKAGPVGGLPVLFQFKAGHFPSSCPGCQKCVEEEACCLVEGAGERGKRNRIDGDRVQSFSLVLPAGPWEEAGAAASDSEPGWKWRII